MSESTASRLDRVGREQRREERQRASSTASASSSIVSSSSVPLSSTSHQSSITSTVSANNDDPQDSYKGNMDSEDSHISTSTSEAGNEMYKYCDLTCMSFIIVNIIATILFYYNSYIL